MSARAALRMAGQTARMALYVMARTTGRPGPLPLNLTVSVTGRCDSHCSTCGIWCADEDAQDELRLEEYDRMFASIGPGSVYFLNISGGEPTMRPDLPEIVRSGLAHLRPSHVHVPVNGVDPDRILATVRRLVRVVEPADAVLSVKPSLDGVGELHDEIRGVPGNYRGVRMTIAGLLELRASHPGRLQVGVGTVISRFNMHATDEIVQLAETLGVDSIIHEIAENRQEMGNEDWPITPSAREYLRAAEPFAEASRRAVASGSADQALRAALRLRMIDLTAHWLRTGTQPLPCYAGMTNLHVNPRGQLWACAVQAGRHRMGDLRRHEMDLPKALATERARQVRRVIREQGCSCPLANQLYANILLSPTEMAKVAALVARRRGAFPWGEG